MRKTKNKQFSIKSIDLMFGYSVNGPTEYNMLRRYINFNKRENRFLATTNFVRLVSSTATACLLELAADGCMFYLFDPVSLTMRAENFFFFILLRMYGAD